MSADPISTPPVSEPFEIDLNSHHARCTTTQNHHGDQRECARVVLAASEHARPADAALHASVPMGSVRTYTARVLWTEPTKQERDTHANAIDAAERGGEAIAIITVLNAPAPWATEIAQRLARSELDLARCYMAGKSHAGSGADYRLRCNDGDDEVIRVECSGISKPTEDEAYRTKRRNDRLQEKKTQLLNGTSEDPGIAVVVDFTARPIVILAELVEVMK